MTVNELIIKLKKDCPDGWGVQAFFDKDYFGECPCFVGKMKLDEGTLKVDGYCWRVSKNYGKQDLIVKGTLPHNLKKRVGDVIRRLLNKQKWYNRYSLIIK